MNHEFPGFGCDCQVHTTYCIQCISGSVLGVAISKQVNYNWLEFQMALSSGPFVFRIHIHVHCYTETDEEEERVVVIGRNLYF